MPVLVEEDRPLVLPAAGSSSLTGAALPTPDSPAWHLVEDSPEAVQGALALPTPAFTPKILVPDDGPGDVIFDRIHVIPRRRDLGAVVSDQEFDVEVWSAFRSRARVLEDLVVSGEGISVPDAPTLPSHYPATDSRLFRVFVDGDGSPDINGLIVWVFTEVDPAGTDLVISGVRAMMYSFRPNMESPIVERFGYRTDVMVATNGKEQRRQLREVPIGTVGYSVLATKTREAQLLNALVFGNQTRPLAVGRWRAATHLTAPGLVDDTTIMVDTTYLPFVAGGLVCLWTSPFTWELRKVDPELGVEPDRIHLVLGLRTFWPTGTIVVPAVLGRFAGKNAVVWKSLGTAAQDVEFAVEGFTP